MGRGLVAQVVLQWLQRLIVEANEAKTINIAPPLLARVYRQAGRTSEYSPNST